MIRFKAEYNYPDQPLCNVELSTNPDISLPDLLQQFEQFLKACGYEFKGHVNILNEEEE